MRWLSITTLTITAVVAGGAGRSESKANKAGLLVMFGAHWCAPCMIEYRNLPAIAAATAPDRVALAWTDRPISLQPSTAANVVSLPADEARRLAQSIAGPGYGLPFSVQYDRNGEVCAVWRKPLDARDIAALRARCLRPATSDRG
jgi:thiol-disulfide isomerase/thioredoxin